MNDKKTRLLRVVFDAIPSFVFVVDDDVRIQEYNIKAAELLQSPKSAVLKRRGGDVLYCIHSTETKEGCGHAPACNNCVIRNSVTEAFSGNRIIRRRAKLEIIHDGNTIELFSFITASPFSFDGKQLVLLVIEDLSEIAELNRMIPICSYCKKVRNDKDTWHRIESYFEDHWGLEFTHGLCPECYEKELKKIEKDSKSQNKPKI
jgi:hypothetical protein